jgi:hypothetical protein
MRAYNALEEKVFKKTIRPIMANGKKYPSVHQASKGENIPRSTLLRYLNDPINLNFYYLVDQEKTNYGKIPIFAKKKTDLVFFLKVILNVLTQDMLQIIKVFVVKLKEKKQVGVLPIQMKKENPYVFLIH